MAQPWQPAEQAAELSRDVIFGDAAKSVPSRILWRPAMKPGDVVAGPAVIEEPNSTILIHPGDCVTVTPAGHLIIDLGRITVE
jgi:N-methylhydantoinase A